MAPISTHSAAQRRSAKMRWATNALAFVFVVFMICLYDASVAPQMDFEDAMYLTRNSFREFKKQHFGTQAPETAGFGGSDLDYPLGSFVNSIFPIDADIRFNVTRDGGVQEKQMIGRFASFSPLIGEPLKGHYKLFPFDACKKLDPGLGEYADKILILLRGNCTFVTKVSNILGSELNPKSIIIANDEPMAGLITMYSSTFNQDGTLTTPVIFIAFESYLRLKKYAADDLVLRISTASLGSWLNIIVSMVLSPPLLILIFYITIKAVQNCRRFQDNKFNEKIVKKLPVYIYCSNHLVYSKQFYDYLKLTRQTHAAIDNADSASSLERTTKPSPSSSHVDLDNYTINGVNIERQARHLDILLMNRDFYPAFKCSICLDKFKPLRSRVLVLECKHFFHEKCLSNWLINFKRSCPLCNHAINHANTSLLAGQEASYGSVQLDLEAAIESEEASDEDLAGVAVEDAALAHAPHVQQDWQREHEQVQAPLGESSSGFYTARTHLDKGPTRPEPTAATYFDSSARMVGESNAADSTERAGGPGS